MKVSVCIITYNHEDFIAKALESALMQEADFDFEIIVGEDCSTDRTREVVLKYANKHSDQIRLILQEQNVGPRRNSEDVRDAAQGDYLAFLDGDDFWTDANKLQTQVDFLDTNPDYSFCGHQIALIEGTDKRVQGNGPELSKRWTMKDQVHNLGERVMHFSSVVVRRRQFPEFPEWIDEVVHGDIIIMLLLLKEGDARFFRKPMGVYRKHAGGIDTGMARRENLLRKTRLYDRMKSIVPKEYHSVLDSKIATRFYDLSELYEGDEDRERADRYLRRARDINPKSLLRTREEWRRLLKRIPFIYSLVRKGKRFVRRIGDFRGLLFPFTES